MPDCNSLADYFAVRFGETIKNRCACIIFDQFEECLTIPHIQDTDRIAFFLDLKTLLSQYNV